MLVPMSRNRAFLAAALILGGLTAAARTNHAQLAQPMTIVGQYKGQTVLLTATRRSAGAIESLQWDGMEFLDASDHGRHLQSAISFDDLNECDNPTEAGASRDGTGPRASSSRLLDASVRDNVLRTDTQMAFWLRRGKWTACGEVKNDNLATSLSSTRLAKSVRFLRGFGNVIEHKISFDLARARSLAQFEVLTAYMPKHFDTFYRYNPADAQLQPLSDGPGEQELPVVLATSDGQHALGLYTPQAAQAGLNGPGYGRWRFSDARVTKSNVVFRQRNAGAGPHAFVVYTVFGSLEDVRATLGKLYESLPPSTVARNASEQSDPAAEVGVLAKN